MADRSAGRDRLIEWRARIRNAEGGYAYDVDETCERIQELLDEHEAAEGARGRCATAAKLFTVITAQPEMLALIADNPRLREAVLHKLGEFLASERVGLFGDPNFASG